MANFDRHIKLSDKNYQVLETLISQRLEYLHTMAKHLNHPTDSGKLAKVQQEFFDIKEIQILLQVANHPSVYANRPFNNRYASN